MRIVFIGSVEFSELALRKLIKLGADIVGIVTKDISASNSDHVDLSNLATIHNIPYKYVRDVNHPNNIKWIRDLNPDIIFCFGWSNLLKKDILTLSRLGVVGYHPSMLPLNRGRHPIIWALALGLEKTGSTFFFMDEGADTGKILDQREVLIFEADNARTLYDRIIDTAQQQIAQFLPLLLSGSFAVTIQNIETGNVWRKRSSKDGLIDFRMSSKAIYNLTRALSKPYVGAHCIYKEQCIKIWKVQITSMGSSNLEPGRVISTSGNTICVKTYDGSINLIEHEFKSLPEIGDYIQ